MGNETDKAYSPLRIHRDVKFGMDPQDSWTWKNINQRSEYKRGESIVWSVRLLILILLSGSLSLGVLDEADPCPQT